MWGNSRDFQEEDSCVVRFGRIISGRSLQQWNSFWFFFFFFFAVCVFAMNEVWIALPLVRNDVFSIGIRRRFPIHSSDFHFPLWCIFYNSIRRSRTTTFHPFDVWACDYQSAKVKNIANRSYSMRMNGEKSSEFHITDAGYLFDLFGFVCRHLEVPNLSTKMYLLRCTSRPQRALGYSQLALILWFVRPQKCSAIQKKHCVVENLKRKKINL